MNKSNIIEKEIILTRIELKQYFELLDKYIDNEGVDAELTYIAIKTLKLLEPEYKNAISGIYNPDNDIKYQQYKQELNQLAFKYADRDEQGEVLLNNNNQPIITEQIIEYQNELNALKNNNKEVLDLVENCNKNNFNFLNQQLKFKIYAWKSIELVSDKIPGLIMYYMFREEFE